MQMASEGRGKSGEWRGAIGRGRLNKSKLKG